jgi:hypothetical protein
MTKMVASTIQDRPDLSEVINQIPHVTDTTSIEKSETFDEKLGIERLEAKAQQTTIEADDFLYDDKGNEKVLETAADFSTALVSLDDDPTLRVYTFRMWFTGIGLAVFGSVLGMLFVCLCSFLETSRGV